MVFDSVVRERLQVPGELRYAGYTAWRGIAPFETAGLIGGETLGCGQTFRAGADHAITGCTGTPRPRRPQGNGSPPLQRRHGLLMCTTAWHQPIPAIIEATDAAMILRNDIYDRRSRRSVGRRPRHLAR